MATYLQQAQLMKNEDFRDRAAIALFHAAEAVRNEGTPPGMPALEIAARRHLADSIYAGPSTMVPLFLYPLVTNPTIAAAGPVNSPDSDLDFVIASHFTEVAMQGQLPL